MDSIVIRGGKPLVGKVNISGAKNAALPIIAASILTDQTLTLSNIPRLTDIHTIQELLASLGAIISDITGPSKEESILSFNCSNINNLTADYNIVRKMRASIWVLAPLLARFGKARVSLPGGCTIGARLVDLHIKVLEAMGAEILIEDGYICARRNCGLKGIDFTFSKVSVGATISAILAATLAEGVTNLSNCAQEPEIVDLCCCLIKMGARITGIGTSQITIEGRKTLQGCEHRVIPDRIEAGTYMVAAAITKGEMDIRGVQYPLIANIAETLKASGALIEQLPEEGGVRVKYNGKIEPLVIDTAPFPGFATDLQAQIMSLTTIASGKSVISENIFENRFMHVPELCRMGAKIKIDNHRAIVQGVKQLKGAEVMASDLRASVSLILAGLAASGQTKVRRVYHLDRGYQKLESKLKSCGAEIERVSGDSV